jgi:hypothetical protein
MLVLLESAESTRRHCDDSTPGIARAPELDPSEIVLLHCDEFAPVPPLTLGARIQFELNYAFGFLMVAFAATVIVAAASQAEYPNVARIIGVVVDLCLLPLWWYFRRRRDPFLDREGIDAVRPLNGTRTALRPQLVELAISAAVLATERAGALQLGFEGNRLMAQFNGSDPYWPTDSLEDRLRRARPISVSELVHDWLADGSNFPFARALRLIEHSAQLRGLAAVPAGTAGVPSHLADLADPKPVQQLLEHCRKERPAIWKAVQLDIAAGVRSRTVEPRREQVGNTSVPKYDSDEAPFSALDTPAPAASQGFANLHARSYLRMRTALLITGLIAGATVFTLLEFNPPYLVATAATAIGVFVSLQLLNLFAKRETLRQTHLRVKYDLPPESASAEASYNAGRPPVTLQQNLAFSAMLSSVAALPVAIWGAWTTIFSLLFLGLFCLVSQSRLRQSRGKLAAQVVAARVNELAAAVAPAQIAVAAPATAGVEERVSAPVQASVPQPALPRSARPYLPETPTAAHDLPPASPRISEMLDRWNTRRARFRRLYYIALGVLIGGYTLLELAFWFGGSTPWISSSSFLDNAPAGLFIMLAATVISFGLWRKIGDTEDGSGNSRHGVLAFVIAVWRIFILIQVPLLFTVGIADGRAEAHRRHPFFVGAALLFLLQHWIWMEWASARIMRDCPVPSPRRLLLLRVFGSPSFDDLVTLIAQWQTVGVIEHLEGFDTVGSRSDVQAAVGSGHVDRILAKTFAEVQEQLNQASTEADKALRFRRHAFQCTNATWQTAILAMLERADAVLMDLSSLSFERQGCAWELGQLLGRVPLANITLLVNDSTDLVCLRSILDAAAEQLEPDSPNLGDPPPFWQLVRIGGLQARLPTESFYDWRRRLDSRLDPGLLTGWLLSTTRPSRTEEALTQTFRTSNRISWATHARWSWLVLLALSAVMAAHRWIH